MCCGIVQNSLWLTIRKKFLLQSSTIQFGSACWNAVVRAWGKLGNVSLSEREIWRRICLAPIRKTSPLLSPHIPSSSKLSAKSQ